MEGQTPVTDTNDILEIIDKSMPSEKSVEIELLVDAGSARNSGAYNFSCPVNSGCINSSAKDCCSISDDESPADDDCIVTLDQKIGSNHKMSSGCIEVDITAQDSTTDDDMQAEVSDLGLKIQDVCSLSSPSQSHTNNILELIDKAPFLVPTVEAQPKPVLGTPCAKKSTDRSVVQFFEQEYSRVVESQGGKSLDWHRNGESSKWQPVVPLVDVMKRPPLRTVTLKKVENPPNTEEEDCVVIENDSKTQDVIVLDDLQDSNSSTSFKATSSATVNNNKRLSSNCCPLSPNAKSSLKRPPSPLREDGLYRKVPRTESADELLILDSPANALNVIHDNSFDLHDPRACGDSEICMNEDFNHELIHIVPDLNGDSGEVSQSSCVRTVVNHRREDEKRTSQSPGTSCEMTNDQGDHVSASSSRIQHGFLQMAAASLSSPSSGLAPVPCAGESSWIKGETYLVDYPGGLCVQGVWDGSDFHVSGSFMKKQEPAKPCESAGVLDAQVTGQPLVVRYPNGLTIRGVWDGFYFSVALPLDTGNPVLGGRGGGDKEKQDADSSSGIEASSSNMRVSSLVSYDLSDSDHSQSSNGNLNVTSTCRDVTVISNDCDSEIISSTLTTQDDDVMPLESTSCSTSEAMSTKTFYGSSASRDDVFPKQYSARHGQHKSKQKRDVTQSIIEDVVHISSDEDDAPRGRRDRGDEFVSGRKSYRTSHDKEKSATPPKSYEEPAQSCTTLNKRSRRKSSSDCVPLNLIKPTKIVYRSKTCIPRECLLTPDHLSISIKKGSFSFDVARFVLGKVKDGRIVFRIPSDVADTLDDMLGLPPEFNPGITSMNSRLTICMDESTPTSTLLALIEQIRSTEMPTDDPSTLPEENEPTKAALQPLTWMQSISKAVRKRLPKRLASWTRPKHWNKPFFRRYGEPRIRVNFRGHSSAAYNPVADDAFVQMEPYDSYYEMQQQPIQVSGFSGTVIKLFTYPPPPIARGIAVTNEDLFCLNAGEYVNDVIIDFYLKYVFNEVLSAEDRARTHIFSSFFYGHLISVTGSSADATSNLTLPEQRHQKVRTWTRQVDIFSKDFIIVPINENYHWFLAIICFPGLCPVAKANNTDSSKATEEKQEKTKNKGSSSDAVTPDESSIELTSGSESNSESTEPKEVVKNPCVLIFDSLQGDIRWDVSRTLREYLQVEWDKKKVATEGRRTFDKDFMKGCRPPCPQQPNYSDCGLYLLQYVEAFFKKPLKDFTLPIRYLRNWFEGSEARAKRSQLRTLILELKEQLNPDLEYDPIADGCCNDVAVNDFEEVI